MAGKLGIDWDDPDIDWKLKDDDLAEVLGCSKQNVNHMRRQLGKPASVWKDGRVQWHRVPELGLLDDEVVAQMYQVSKSTVKRQRLARGLSAP